VNTQAFAVGGAPARAPTRLLLMLAATAGAAAASVLYLFNPLAYSFYPRCLLLRLTGLYCPGCGCLRATYALLHGHLLQALDYNALYVLTLPFAAWIGLDYLSAAVSGRRLPMYTLSGRQAKLVLALVVAFAVLRNLPWAPFAVLAP
jgi:hypothetical protein